MAVVKVSSWIKNDSSWQCPECGAEWELGADETPESMEMNYCYKCGTKLIEDITLKSCPFCGGEADAVTTDEEIYIACKECGVHTPHNQTKKIGVDTWNKRKSIVSAV